MTHYDSFVEMKAQPWERQLSDWQTPSRSWGLESPGLRRESSQAGRPPPKAEAHNGSRCRESRPQQMTGAVAMLMLGAWPRGRQGHGHAHSNVGRKPAPLASVMFLYHIIISLAV